MIFSCFSLKGNDFKSFSKKKEINKKEKMLSSFLLYKFSLIDNTTWDLYVRLSKTYKIKRLYIRLQLGYMSQNQFPIDLSLGNFFFFSATSELLDSITQHKSIYHIIGLILHENFCDTSNFLKGDLLKTFLKSIKYSWWCLLDKTGR